MEKERKADLENVIINLYEADHSALAFKDFDNNAGNMLKVMIDFNNFTDHRFIKNGVSPFGNPRQQTEVCTLSGAYLCLLSAARFAVCV